MPEQKTKPEKEKPEKNYKLTLTDTKIKKLLAFDHLEELFHLLSILDEKQIRSFLEHYQKSEISHTQDIKIERIFKNAKTPHELMELTKKEIGKTLLDEFDKIRSKISDLRKKGKDLYIEDIKSLQVPAKIKMFQSTGKKEDFYKVKKILEELTKKADESIEIQKQKELRSQQREDSLKNQNASKTKEVSKNSNNESKSEKQESEKKKENKTLPAKPNKKEKPKVPNKNIKLRKAEEKTKDGKH